MQYSVCTRDTEAHSAVTGGHAVCRHGDKLMQPLLVRSAGHIALPPRPRELDSCGIDN